MTLRSKPSDFLLPGKSLRIALVAEAMDTGLGSLLCLLATGLAERGHEVHLLHSVMRADPAVLARLRTCPGIHCQAIDMRRQPGLKDIAAGIAVRRYLRRNGPFDVVHGHSAKGGALARLFAIGLPGVRLYTPHAFFTLSPRLAPQARRACALVERMLGWLCSTVICSSEMEYQHARTLGIPAGRLRILPNAIEPVTLSTADRERFGAGDDAFMVGFVGRMEYQKGPDLLLRALAHACRYNPRIHLAMIGDGSLEASLKTLSCELGIQDRVTWLGRVPSNNYLASFDVLTMASRYEGFSLMPLEAMQAGLPIICTPVGGVAETVIDGGTGIVVPVDDEQKLSDAILALAADPAGRTAMGAAARARAQMFSPLEFIDASERFYYEALARETQASGGAVQPTTPVPISNTPVSSTYVR